jgi:hypothetical protein
MQHCAAARSSGHHLWNDHRRHHFLAQQAAPNGLCASIGIDAPGGNSDNLRIVCNPGAIAKNGWFFAAIDEVGILCYFGSRHSATIDIPDSSILFALVR